MRSIILILASGLLASGAVVYSEAGLVERSLLARADAVIDSSNATAAAVSSTDATTESTTNSSSLPITTKDSADKIWSHKIDVHSHFLPPDYQQALKDAGITSPDGFPVIPQWNQSAHLAYMKQAGVAHSAISISSPGCHLVEGNDAAAVTLCQSVNNQARAFAQQYPKKISYFCSLPLPAVSASVAEIKRCLTLDPPPVGFNVLTNVHGKYFSSDPTYDPVYSALNAAKAVIHVHPSTPHCIVNGHQVDATPLSYSFKANPPMEFVLDTGRFAVDMIYHTLPKYPNIDIILSHSGGVLSALLDRVTSLFPLIAIIEGSTPLGDRASFLKTLNAQVWFDMAGTPFTTTTHGDVTRMLDFTTLSRFCYGGDWPFTPIATVVAQAASVTAGVTALTSKVSDWLGVSRQNAIGLFTASKAAYGAQVSLYDDST